MDVRTFFTWSRRREAERRDKFEEASLDNQTSFSVQPLMLMGYANGGPVPPQ